MLYNEKTIENPYLPEYDVTAVAISRLAESAIKQLNLAGVKTYITDFNSDLDDFENSHPDLHLFSYGQGVLFADKSFGIGELKEKFQIYNKAFVKGKEYPDNVSLNALRISNKLIANVNTLSREILNKAINENLIIINVNQGYTKCSICPVDNNSFITDDISIYKSSQNYFDDILLIEKGSVRLKNMNYGFIGGCTGKLSKNIIAFNGRLESHKNHNDIYDFIIKHNCTVKELCNDYLTDIGSIIPLLEKNDEKSYK